VSGVLVVGSHRSIRSIMTKELDMPAGPIEESTIEDEDDANFELAELFKEPRNRSMAAVTAHTQQLIFIDARVKDYL
jgi:hypothetical protein